VGIRHAHMHYTYTTGPDTEEGLQYWTHVKVVHTWVRRKLPKQ
jgi:hypothetical protein